MFDHLNLQAALYTASALATDSGAVSMTDQTLLSFGLLLMGCCASLPQGVVVPFKPDSELSAQWSISDGAFSVISSILNNGSLSSLFGLKPLKEETAHLELCVAEGWLFAAVAVGSFVLTSSSNRLQIFFEA